MSEYGSTTIGKETQNLEIADAFDPYSGVRLSVGLDDDGNELVYFSGDETGRVLDVENPFGSQQMADNILASIQGFVYQPMYADGALLDPAAQIGDAVSVNDIYSRICVRATTFGTLMLSDVSSPASEEIVHEYNIPTPEERQFQRLNYDMKSEFKITNQAISAEVSARQSADSSLSGRIDVNATAITAEVTARQQADSAEATARQNGDSAEASARQTAVTELSGRIDVNASAITAKVSKNSPSGQTSFGWALSDTEWRVFNQSGNILRATSAGLEVKGKIQADEGYIGGENGFVITASKMYKNISRLGDYSQSSGVYIGTDGIQLGKGFRVDSSGNLHVGEIDSERTETHYDFPVRFFGGTYVTGSQYPIYFTSNGYPVNAVYVLTEAAYQEYQEDPIGFDLTPYLISSQAYTITYDPQTLLRTCTFTGTYLGSLDVSHWYVVCNVGNSTLEYVTLFAGDFEKANYFANFDVTSSGAVTATSLSILGGSIRIGNNFVVDSNGNLYAETGYFRGGVSAGSVEYGADYGYFDGYGLTGGTVEGGVGGALADYTIETDNLVNAITASLANGESAYDAITNNGYIVVNNVDFRNYPVSWKAVRMADGTTGYAMCR